MIRNDQLTLVTIGAVEREVCCVTNVKCEQSFSHHETMVFPSTKSTNENSMKKIVMRRPRSTVHPNMVIPPGFICKYITAYIAIAKIAHDETRTKTSTEKEP
ncbi:hypothetical protein U1Q18_017228 [Sarracenia purpurea var. burkii]